MEVKVICTRRRGRDVIDIVQRPDGLQIAVPRWMLDPLACQQLPQEAKPRVALHALLRLVEMMPTRGLPGGTAASVLGVSPPTKGDHASKENPTVLSGAVASSQKDALAPVPRTDPRSVPSVVDSTASPSGAPSRPGKDPR
jgi:hypothetical protein